MPKDRDDCPGFRTTLGAVRILLRWQVLLTAFAVCAVCCEICVVFLLKLARTAGEGFHWQTAVVGAGVVFVALCWGGFLVASEADTLFFPPKEKRRFGGELVHKPLHFLLPPLFFVCAFGAVFLLQVGIASIMKLASLPAHLFPLMFVLQFAAAAADIVLAVLVAVFLFLWPSHISLRGGVLADSLRSFAELLSNRTFRVLGMTFLWAVIVSLLFWYAFFPAWKTIAAQTMKASRIAIGERFENEIVGHDNLLACVVAAVESPSLTPGGTLENLAGSLEELRERLGRETDPFNVRGVSGAGLFFLVALVLTFAVPAGITLALFNSAGAYAYRVIVNRVPGSNGTAASGFISAASSHPAAPPSDDEDTFVEEIAPEPLDGAELPPADKNALERFVDFDYGYKKDKKSAPTPPPVADNPFSGAPSAQEKGTQSPAGKAGSRLRDPVPQEIPPESGQDDEEDYTIFDLLDENED